MRKNLDTTRRRLPDHADRDAGRDRPLRDHGGPRGPRGNPHRLAARAQRVVPEDRGRADGRLDTEPGRHGRALHRSRRSEHAGVLRQEEGLVAVPSRFILGTAGS